MKVKLSKIQKDEIIINRGYGYDFSVSFVLTRSSKKESMAIDNKDGEQAQMNKNEVKARVIEQQAALIQNL